MPRETRERNNACNVAASTPNVACGLEKSNPPGGGKTSEGILIVDPAVTATFETTARNSIALPGDQSSFTATESAAILIPAVSGTAGIGLSRNSACCPAMSATVPAPVAGRSNVRTSASHQGLHGALAIDNRKPSRS